jgi:hypothetical protein
MSTSPPPPLSSRAVLGLGLFFLLLPHLVYSFLFQTPLGNDFVSYQPLALLRFLACWEADILPVWSPWMFGGMSTAFENALSQALSPLSWLYFFIPSVREGELLRVLIHFKLFFIGLGGCFTFLFLRQIQCGVWGAVFGSLIFMFNFRMWDNLRYQTPLEVLVSLPLLCWILEKWITQRWRPTYWLYPTVLGLMLLSGHPQHSLYNLLFLSSYMVFRSGELYFKNRKDPAIASVSFALYFKALFQFALLNSAGFILALPLLLPFQQEILPALEVRVSGSSEWSQLHQLTPLSLFLNLIFPWFAEVHSSFYCSLGVYFIFFALLVWLQKRSFSSVPPLLYFFLAYFTFTLLYALGSWSGVFYLVSRLVFPLRASRGHGRILGTGIFCLGVLCAWTLTQIEQGFQRQKPLAWPPVAPYFAAIISFLSVSFLAVVCILSFYWNFFNILKIQTNRLLEFLARLISAYILDVPNAISLSDNLSLILWQVGAAFFFFFATALCFRYAYHPRFRHGLYAFLCFAVLLESFFYHRKALWMLDSFPQLPKTATYRNLDTFHQRVFEPTLFEYGWPLQEVIAENWTLRSIVASNNAPKSIVQFLKAGGRPAELFFGHLPEGKVVFTPAIAVVPDVYHALKKNTQDLRQICFLSEREAQQIPLSLGLYSPPQTPVFDFQIESYTPNQIRFRATSNVAGIWTYLDLYTPHFKAFVDQKPAPLLKTYETFKGIALPAGTHQVHLFYQPRAFLFGIRCAGVLLLFLLALALYDLFHKLASCNFCSQRFLRLLLFFFLLGIWGNFCFFLRNQENTIRHKIENPILFQYLRPSSK